MIATTLPVWNVKKLEDMARLLDEQTKIVLVWLILTIRSIIPNETAFLDSPLGR